jgi:predicted metal-dependent hydrolase
MLLGVNKKIYQDGEEYLYLGNTVTLTIGKYTEIYVAGGKLLFPDFLQFRLETELKNWFMKQAREIITQSVSIHARRMHVSYTSLSFSDTKSKWGSCTHDNRLQFCWRLVMAPILVINYVVIHELVHIVEKNHSDNFWRKVRLYNPSYKQHIKWLKTHGDMLVI